MLNQCRVKVIVDIKWDIQESVCAILLRDYGHLSPLKVDDCALLELGPVCIQHYK